MLEFNSTLFNNPLMINAAELLMAEVPEYKFFTEEHESFQEDFKGSGGYCTWKTKTIVIEVNNRPEGDILGTLAHEVGHAKRPLYNIHKFNSPEYRKWCVDVELYAWEWSRDWLCKHPVWSLIQKRFDEVNENSMSIRYEYVAKLEKARYKHCYTCRLYIREDLWNDHLDHKLVEIAY